MRAGRSNEATLGAALRLRVELWLAIVFMAVSFAAGVVVRGLAQPQPEPLPVASGFEQSAQIAAPPLTSEQIGQGLPEGHPSIGEDAGKGGERGAGDDGKSD